MPDPQTGDPNRYLRAFVQVKVPHFSIAALGFMVFRCTEQLSLEPRRASRELSISACT
jgi:hypothetical protein